MSWRGDLIKAGMSSDGKNIQVFNGNLTAFNVAADVAKTYYVDRNTILSGNGITWETAFLTLAEAIAAVNADYAAAANSLSRGRMRRIIVAEGWYAEVPATLTASDVHIVGVAPGHHDSTVIYGVPVAGTFSGVAGGPALTITGSNCTIENLGFYTSDPLFASLQIGALQTGVYGNKIKGCNFVRDVADGSLGGILDYGADGTLIEDCFFSTSCKDWGIKIDTNGVINPVNPVVRFCRFVGTPTGVLLAAGHNLLVHGCWFLDDTSDRADTCDNPIVVNGTSCHSSANWSTTNKADLVTGTGTITEAGNYGSDSST